MSLQVVGTSWELEGSNNDGGSINAQCAPWTTILGGSNSDGSALTSYNSRKWTASQAMGSHVEFSYGPQAIQNVTGSTSSTAFCFISGIDGDFLSDGDSSQAAITLWWPGETSPNPYTQAGGDGTHWRVQISNSSTEAFYNAHVTCIDIGMVDPGGGHAFNDLTNVGRILGNAFWSGLAPYAMTNVDANACVYTQIVGYGSKFGNLQTSQNGSLDLVSGFPNSWTIGAVYNSNVSWLYQECLALR
jgi:hypothetical protein